MEILRRLLLALEQAQNLTDVNIAAGQLRQELDEAAKPAYIVTEKWVKEPDGWVKKS